MLINVICEFAEEHNGLIKTQELVDEMLSLGRDRLNWLSQARFLLTRKSGTKLLPINKLAYRSALEIARRLELYEVLENATSDEYDVIRFAAARNIYFIWRADVHKGSQIFETLVNRFCQTGGLPNIPLMESCFAIGILFLRHYSHETEAGRAIGSFVLEQIQRMVRRLLLVQEGNSAVERFFATPAREILINTIVQFVVRTQESYPPEKPSFLKEVGELMTADSEVKNRFNRLLAYFRNPTTLADIRKDLEDGVKDNDTLTQGLVFLMLISEFTSKGLKDYSTFSELHELNLNQPNIGSASQSMIIALGMVGELQHETSDAFYSRLKKMTLDYVNQSRGFYVSKSGTRHPNLAINPLLNVQQLRQNPADGDVLLPLLQGAIAENDIPLFKLLIGTLATQSTNAENAESLKTLESLLPFPPAFYDQIADTLARIRIYHRVEVDAFLMNMDNENFSSLVQRLEPSEQLWAELFHNIYASILVKLLYTPEIKLALFNILEQATQQKSLNNYLKWMVKYVMNLLTGENLFRV